METYAITIARGFGTGGREIASKLADELGIHSYENRILTLAAQYSGMVRSQIQRMQKRFLPQGHMEEFVSDDRLFQIEAKIIRELVKAESCIIVGKCSDYLLKDYDNVLSVYIEAPRAYCLKQVMDRMDVTEEEAARLITKTDKYRADYYKYYTNGNYWTNPVNYDLTLNSGRLGQEKCVEMIKSALKIKLGVEV